jgi:RNA-directed DNA polymerase
LLADWLAEELALDASYVHILARTASHRYKTYSIPKRSGGFRTIYHPSRELKGIQRWLLRRVIEYLPVHDAVAAYRRGSSIAANARLHVGSRFLLRMDLQSFFESLSAEDVLSHLQSCRPILASRSPGSWENNDDTLFAELVCRRRQLVIGAVTSPALSNSLCYELDRSVHEVCDAAGVTYSRYADDMFFSVSLPNVLKDIEARIPEILRSLNYPRRLAVNAKKTIHSSRATRRVVTGLRLTSTGTVSLGRTLKRQIRSLVYRSGALPPKDAQRLRGMLAYCRGIEPDFVASLILKFGESLMAPLLHSPTKATGDPAKEAERANFLRQIDAAVEASRVGKEKAKRKATLPPPPS